MAGFDIAGAEDGFPPDRFLPAFRYLREQNAVYTIHAGEAAGVDSIWSAVQRCCGAIGSATAYASSRTSPWTATARRRWGASPRTSGTGRSRWRCARPPTCRPAPSGSVAEHPIRLLDDLGFAVTVNCDDQLMTGTRLSDEFHLLCGVLGYDLEGVRRLSLNAARAAFAPLPVREALVDRITEYASDA